MSNPVQPKHLVIIFGPPAVGKMTVGAELARLTGLPLFHNHVAAESILRFFPFGHPAFRRLVEEIDHRYRMNSARDFCYPDCHLRIDNNYLAPEVVARRIAQEFGLAVVTSEAP